MNSVLAAEVGTALEQLEPPTEYGHAVRAEVGTTTEDGRQVWRAYWQRSDGRDFFGPSFDYGSDVHRFVDEVNKRLGPKVGDKLIVDRTRYEIRMAWRTDDRLDARSVFGNSWVTVRAADLDWDTVQRAWRERAA